MSGRSVERIAREFIQVRVAGMTFYRVVDGRVVEERGVADVLGLMQQLGALG